MLNYHDLIDLFKARRSIRAFKPDPLPEGTVEKIIEAARWSPSGGDGQPWEFVVIQQPALNKKIVELYRKARKPPFAESRTMIPILRETIWCSRCRSPGSRMRQFSSFSLAILD